MKYQIPQMQQKWRRCDREYFLSRGFSRLPRSWYIHCQQTRGIGIDQSAALEAAKSGIRLNAICPGAIQTEMMQRFAKVNPQMVEQMREIYPIGRFGQPEEIEAAVVWLCLDRAFFVTGQSLAIDGGYVIQ